MPAPSYLIDLDSFRRFLRARNLSLRTICDRHGISRTTFRRWMAGSGLTAKTARTLVVEVGIPRGVIRSREEYRRDLRRFIRENGFLTPSDRRRPCAAQLVLEEVAR